MSYMAVQDFINNVLTDFFMYFDITNNFEQVTAISFAGVYLFVIIIRIIISLGYQSKYAMLTLAKPIASKDTILKIKSGYLSSVLQNYAALGEKGIGNIDTRAIVEKNLLKFNFLGWNYRSMERLLGTFEQSILLIGAIMVFLFDSKLFFGALCLVVFVLIKLLSSFFDFEISREKLLNETIYYVSRELGKFYISDAANAVTIMKLELKSLMTNQSKIIDDSLKKLTTELTGAINISMESLTKGTDEVISRLASQALIITDPMAKWAQTLSDAAVAQEGMNENIKAINNAITTLSEISGSAGNIFNDFLDKIAENGKHLENQIATLVSAIADLKESNVAFEMRAEEASANLELVKTNQTALDHAVSQYEISLKNLTGRMGDAFGKMIDLHVRETYNSLNDGISDNIKTIINSNNDLMSRLQVLFEQLQNQSKSETEMIVRITEQMDTLLDNQSR